MDRRDFIKTVSVGAVLLNIGTPLSLLSNNDNIILPQLAITIDDPNRHQIPLMSPDEKNEAILTAMRKHSDLKAALFVCGHCVDNPAGKKLLQSWNDAGHILGNHTYSHHYFHSDIIGVETFMADILKCEKLIQDFSQFRKLFRFPYLKEGDTLEKRDIIRAFLKENGYKHGYVTIDASDWYIEDRMKKRLEQNPEADLEPYKQFYLEHIWKRANYYKDLAMAALKRPVRHTLLIHYNLLNALFLDALLDMFENKGWRLINAAAAFEDSIFSLEPDILPAGESIIWALAKETGEYDEKLRYPGEDSQYEEEKMDGLGL
jgi:peptidoglycan/xylan/chitin deacetylase (PgdA/CDA1 family)